MTSSASGTGSKPYVLLTPCFDDWESIAALLPLVDHEMARLDVHLRILIVDDGSRLARPDPFAVPSFEAIDSVEVLTLLRNLGHQRALCVGLCHISSDERLKGGAGVIVMDADGEDAPADIARLLKAFAHDRGERAIFASRVRRSEGIAFRSFYWLYRVAHRALTGIPVRIGNFSVLPMSFARRLTVVSETWNHYAAAVVQSRLPMEFVPANRAPRLRGESRMNFVSLVSHGLSAMSVFADRIGVRALIASMATILVLGLGLLAVIGVRLYTTMAIPGWATSAAGILALLLMQSLLLALVFAFLIHLGRSGSGFLPARDYAWYVDRVDTVWSAHGTL